MTSRPTSVQRLIGLAVLAASLVLAVLMGTGDQRLTILWVLGIGTGFTLQRSRFCFASAFRDLFLFGSGRIMKGILVGLAVATAGFAIVMRNLVPFATFGALPPEAHVLPAGASTVVGGLLFGLGMVLAGGCVSGSLYRSAEGYVGSWVAIAGVIAGLGFISQTWNLWWQLAISAEPKLWLPAMFRLGYGGAVVVTLVGLAAAYLLVLWREAKAGLPAGGRTQIAATAGTVGERLAITARSVFVSGWSPITAGAILGGLDVLMYQTHMPWGVTGELSRWANGAMSVVGLPAPVAVGLSTVGGCAARAGEAAGLFSHTFSVTVGLVVGALAAALLAQEFKLRLPRKRRRYLQSLGGGLLMGCGAGLAVGCTIGAFFSSVASLSVSGWLFALALLAGAGAGTRLIGRLG